MHTQSFTEIIALIMVACSKWLYRTCLPDQGKDIQRERERERERERRAEEIELYCVDQSKYMEEAVTYLQ